MVGEVAFWEVISRPSLAVFPEVRNRNETESRLSFFDSWGLMEFFGPHARTWDVYVIVHISNHHSPKKICSSPNIFLLFLFCFSFLPEKQILLQILITSSLSIHFLDQNLSHFVSALLSRMSQKNLTYAL